MIVVVSSSFRRLGLLPTLRTVSFLTCQKCLETQVIYCQLLFLHGLILFLRFILTRCIIHLLRIVTLRNSLALHLLQSGVAISLPPFLRPLLLLLLLAALRRHHYLHLRIPVLLLNYLVYLSAAHAGISVAA